MNIEHRPAWLEVDLTKLANNIKEVKRIINEDTKICAVVKADGYKLGAVKAAEVYIENGASMLAVAILDEALELRKTFKDIPILVLGLTPDDSFETAVKNDITLTISTLLQGIGLNNISNKTNKITKIHIKIETGMNRLGFLDNLQSIHELQKLNKLPNIMIEGIYTHLAKADFLEKNSVYSQKKRFDDFYDLLLENEISIPIRHISNSAAIIDLPDLNYEMVRPGVILTGLYPSGLIKPDEINLKLAFKLKTRIALIKQIKKGEGVSYGHRFVADKDMSIGILPIGYADGFSRMLSGKMEVSTKGIRCRTLGIICMDQCVIDLSEVDEANIGDEVIVYDDGTSNGLHPDEVAKIMGTINYEIISMLDRRLPRIYICDDEIIEIKNYLY